MPDVILCNAVFQCDITPITDTVFRLTGYTASSYAAIAGGNSGADSNTVRSCIIADVCDDFVFSLSAGSGTGCWSDVAIGITIGTIVFRRSCRRAAICIFGNYIFNAIVPMYAAVVLVICSVTFLWWYLRTFADFCGNGWTTFTNLDFGCAWNGGSTVSLVLWHWSYFFPQVLLQQTAAFPVSAPVFQYSRTSPVASLLLVGATVLLLHSAAKQRELRK